MSYMNSDSAVSLRKRRSKRIGELEFLRFVFAIEIILWHTNVLLDTRISTGGYRGVEFFYIITGYFLAYSLSHMRRPEAGNLTSSELASETKDFIIKKSGVFFRNM